MRRGFLFFAFMGAIVLGLPANVLQAVEVYPIDIFTQNGLYYNDLDLSVEVSDGTTVVDFTFNNASLIDSSLARIYFEECLFLGTASITNGPGTSFLNPTIPGNLPGAGLLQPPFVAAEEFSISGAPPPSHEGVNPGEWVKITFPLINSGTYQGVIDELNAETLRIGGHIIALSDGSSESGVVPEPTTVALLGLGALALLRKRRA
ncbi:MAG: PEP-CTERM sorting domain-containing protein [Planctomycetota bacterium]|jgi:hypothetical protein